MEGLIYCMEPTTKKWKTEKSKKNGNPWSQTEEDKKLSYR